jgi:hypothetical protein
VIFHEWSGLFQKHPKSSAKRNERSARARQIPLVHKGFTASIEVTS